MPQSREMAVRGGFWMIMLLAMGVLPFPHAAAEVDSARPNIIFILADDLGWNDVGFHGSAQIPTPNLDALAYSGIILNRYYVNPICTPSRSALMTGKYPIHTGMQHTVLYAMEPRGLPLSEKLLPQYLKDLGYSNHIVGKWHLGHYQLRFTPTQRGFDSHTGFWTGHHHMNDHTAVEHGHWGLDMRRGYDVAYDLHGQYTTHVLGAEAIAIVQGHNKSSPLFLYVAHAAVHSANPYDFLPAPDETVANLGHIENYRRRKFAAMMVELDRTVGSLVDALHARDMLENTIIVFSSDNGGPADGFNDNAASNWPLRGVKNTLWEGGLRAAGFIWSPLLQNVSRVSHQMVQVCDWLPTLYEAAGGNVSALPTDLDGISVWHELSSGAPTRRIEILHNIDDIWGTAALTVGNWKLVKGSHYNRTWDGWYGPAGIRDEKAYALDKLANSPAGKVMEELSLLPTPERITQLRREATVSCGAGAHMASECDPLERPCLYDVESDPCEYNNLAEEHLHILQSLLARLADYNSTAVPPSNLEDDPRGEPQHWNFTWHNFGDEPEPEVLLNEHVD
ncbi:arylsulfatase B isoform X1 [Anopheles arabiensis]|uniref:Sulfatase N-terminal domain-containing protein n=2 Tax=Anopheles arabiensis TaxID=7173 RepID=A0A182HHX8_ANOAR|nr:arylsulfatase B isoform X1 [Anopheles arabiensis]XP_552160.4 arylsulfatase B [Anopheles gambiae]